MNIPVKFTQKHKHNTPIAMPSRIKWKPVETPEDFTLVIDTREQQPLFQKPPRGLTVIHRKLDNGDYSVLGFEDKIFIERKKLSDLLLYIGKERKTTVSKLMRVRDFAFKGLIIEANEKTLYNNQLYSQVTKEMVEGFLLSFEIRFGGHYKCCQYRSDCERWVLNHAVYTFKRLRLLQKN